MPQLSLDGTYRLTSAGRDPYQICHGRLLGMSYANAMHSFVKGTTKFDDTQGPSIPGFTRGSTPTKNTRVQSLHAMRAEIERTISQEVRAFGARRCRYVGEAKAHFNS